MVQNSKEERIWNIIDYWLLIIPLIEFYGFWRELGLPDL